MQRRLVWLTAVAVAALFAIPHGALADGGHDGNDDEAELTASSRACRRPG